MPNPTSNDDDKNTETQLLEELELLDPTSEEVELVPGDDAPAEDDADGDLSEEDDDNAYQESDEALPDDEEEEAIERNPEREEKRFDEV